MFDPIDKILPDETFNKVMETLTEDFSDIVVNTDEGNISMYLFILTGRPEVNDDGIGIQMDITALDIGRIPNVLRDNSIPRQIGYQACENLDMSACLAVFLVGRADIKKVYLTGGEDIDEIRKEAIRELNSRDVGGSFVVLGKTIDGRTNASMSSITSVGDGDVMVGEPEMRYSGMCDNETHVDAYELLDMFYMGHLQYAMERAMGKR